jgi:hypothetical protein
MREEYRGGMSSFSGSEKQWEALERSLIPSPDPLSQEERIRLGGENERWTLIVGPRSLNFNMLGVIARMSKDGPVRVLDGGNRFNAYVVARAAGGQPEILNRITVSRAFTCYQVLSLLESTPAIQVALSEKEPAPPDLARLVIMDLLNTYYDESVHPPERKQLLKACLFQLGRLAGTGRRDEQAGPGRAPPTLLITVHPPAVGSQTATELLRLLLASPLVEPYFIPPERPAPEPLRLL